MATDPNNIPIVHCDAGPHTDDYDCPQESIFAALSNMRVSCRRREVPLAVLMLDLDRFRDCNERHSAEFGDRVLQWFGLILKSQCGASDLVSRYQGDRFIVGLLGVTTSGAAQLAQRCRERMRTQPVVLNNAPHEITASVGMTESTPAGIESEHQLIQHARIALECAKHRGGDRIVTWAEIMDARRLQRNLRDLSSTSTSHWVHRTRQQLRHAYMESTQALVAAADAKDPHMRNHSRRVAAYAMAIGKRMRLSSSVLERLNGAALLHDIGKIAVPDAILTKPGRLTPEEFAIIKRHPATALDILGRVSFLTGERPLILHHHERYDGQGYPGGVAGNRIPIAARILAVADALDAMFSARSYKRAYDRQKVRSELVAATGKQFDPNVTEVALSWLDEKARHPVG